MEDIKLSITLKEYSYLVARDKELSRLEAAGVDNWEGYYTDDDEEDEDED